MRSERLRQWKIASPCKVAWADMTGDDRKRTCGDCDKQVYNLSSMTAAEADALLAATNGQVCTYFYRRLDGTVMTSDCAEARWGRFTRRVSGGVAATAGLALTVLTSISPRAEGSTFGQTLTRLATPAPEPDPPLGGAPPEPPHVEATIVDEAATSAGTMLTLSSGTSVGVAAGDSGYLLDKKGTYIPGSELVVSDKGLSKDHSEAITKLAPAAIAKGDTAMIEE